MEGGDRKRGGREARVPWPRGQVPGIAGRRFQRRFAPGQAQGTVSPSSRGQGVTDLSEVSFPPTSPSHLPNCPPLSPPSALPPSQQSSRGWHPPREPRAGLAAAVRGSSLARRNSRHSGWPCGSAWQAWSGFEPPETGPATRALAGLPPLVTEAEPARAAPHLSANQGAARSRIGLTGRKRARAGKIPPRAAVGAERGAECKTF